MELTQEERDILDGKQGETLAKVMRTLVEYGEAFGATRMVKVTAPGHLVTSFGISILNANFRLMDELIDAGLKTKEPFTVDPRPIDNADVPASLVQKVVGAVTYSKQESYERQLRAVGLKDENAFTCACYLPEVGNTPKRGDILSWAESSAVVYANSVLGARCNRNSGFIDLFGNIVGEVPEFGFLTDEGRICLVRQFRTALDRVTVEIPAGKLDPGEDPLDAAHRELAEETGMQAEKMAYLTTIASSDGFCDELIHIYMATGLSFHQSSPDADEFINVDLVDLSELVDAVLDGRIEDAKTVVGALICDAIAHRLAPGEAAGPVNDPANEGNLDG